MAKTKIRQSDKQEILKLIIINLLKNYPEYDMHKYIKEQMEKNNKYITEYIQSQLFDIPGIEDWFKRHIITTDKYHLGYNNIFVYNNESGEYTDVSEHFYIKNMTYTLLEGPVTNYPKEYADKLSDQRTIRDVAYSLYHFMLDDMKKYVNQKIKEFDEKVLSNFKNIIYSINNLEDCGTMIPLPEVISYIEKRKNNLCTSLCTANFENIDFVKKYVESIKK